MSVKVKNKRRVNPGQANPWLVMLQKSLYVLKRVFKITQKLDATFLVQKLLFSMLISTITFVLGHWALTVPRPGSREA